MARLVLEVVGTDAVGGANSTPATLDEFADRKPCTAVAAADPASAVIFIAFRSLGMRA